jgi:hypothetical protein
MTKEDKFYEAVRLGVRDAMMELVFNGTSMPCADLLDSFKEGVREGFEKTALGCDFEAAVERAVAGAVKDSKP